MKKWMSLFLGTLGTKALDKKDGKPFLTEDQKKTLQASFGESVVSDFEAYLAQGDGSAPEASDDEIVTKLIAGITGQQAAAHAAMQAKINDLAKRNGGLEALVNALKDRDEEEPILEVDKSIRRKAGVEPVMRVDMRKGHYAKVGEFLKTGVNSAAYNATTIEVTDLREEFGTYLNNQRNLDIIREILVGFETSKHMTTVLAVTEWRAIRAHITSVVQQFTPKWTPLGKGKFTPITIKNRRQKINVPIIPAEVLDSYLFHLYDEGLAPDQMPITKYITETLVKPQILQDIELRMVAKGKYVEKDWNTVNTGDPGTAPEDAVDGFETILVDSKALVGTASARGINYFNRTINWKNATDQQVIDFVNEFVDWINPQYQTQAMPVFCSLDVYKRYKRAYKKIWGANDGGNSQFGQDVIDYSQNVLTVLPSMYKSPIIFSTPKANFIKLRHKNEVPNIINDVQKHDYEVKLFGEFWFGVGFAIGEAVFAYVPAGYNPKAQITANWGDYDEYQSYEMTGSDTYAGDGSDGGGI
jgi:hypothetical protein